MNKKLANKVVIVTGSSMGIGKQLAKQVLEYGGKVVITGRNEVRLKATEIEFAVYKNSVLTHAGDLTKYSNNVDLVRRTINRFGALDVLVTNAGLSCFGDVANMSANAAREIIDVNIYGSLYPVMVALPELKKTGGSVLFISSLAGIHGLPGYSAYSLSKMSLTALSQSLCIEMKPFGVFVGIAYVGFTENEEEKKTLSPEGKWLSVPKRPKLLTQSREQTALGLLKQIRNKKHSSIQSLFGKFTYQLNRFFPLVLRTILKLNHKT